MVLIAVVVRGVAISKCIVFPILLVVPWSRLGCFCVRCMLWHLLCVVVPRVANVVWCRVESVATIRCLCLLLVPSRVVGLGIGLVATVHHSEG